MLMDVSLPAFEPMNLHGSPVIPGKLVSVANVSTIWDGTFNQLEITFSD